MTKQTMKDIVETVFEQQLSSSIKKPIVIPIIQQLTVDHVIAFVFPQRDEGAMGTSTLSNSFNTITLGTNKSKYVSGFRLFLMGDFMQSVAQIRRMSTKNPDEEVVQIGMITRGLKRDQPHVLTASEIETMMSDVEDRVYADIYKQNLTVMSSSERSALRRGANRIIPKAMDYTKQEIREILSDRGAKRRLSLHRREGEPNSSFFQRVIESERRFQIKELRKASPDLSKLRDKRALESRQYSVWNKCNPRVFGDGSNFSDFNTVSRLLSSKTSTLNDMNNRTVSTGDLTNNVKLIRHEDPKRMRKEEAWDNNCCTRRGGRIDHVRTRKGEAFGFWGIESREERVPLPTDDIF